MKSISIVLVALVVFLLQIIPSVTVSSLSPPLCYHDNTCSPREMCRMNTSTWPRPTPKGAYDKCKDLSDKTSAEIEEMNFFERHTIAIVLLTAALTLASIYLIIRKLRKRPTGKTNRKR